MKSDYKECYNNLGVLYDALDQYDEAVRFYKKAIKLDKYYKDPYFNLAVTYEKMSKYKLAGIYYQDYLDFFAGEGGAFLSGVRKKVEILAQLPVLK